MKRAFKSSLTVVVICALASFAAAQKKYDIGATDQEIKIGQSMPYSGPASALGTMGKVELAYVRKINEEGGINGRKINLISLDDGYIPAKTVEVTRRLVEQEEVLAVAGTLGTATSAATQRYLNSKGVPQLLAKSIASRFVDSKMPWSMPFAPSAFSEAKAYAKHLLSTDPGVSKIAVLYQNDDLGKDYLAGLQAGLGDKASAITALSYEITDPTISSQITTLKSSGANVFFSFTTPKFAAMAIRLVSDSGWKPTQYVAYPGSSIGSVLTPAGLDRSTGVLTALFLKDPHDPQMSSTQGAKDYLSFMAKYYPEGDTKDVNNVYSYTAIQLLFQILKQSGDDLTRKNVMRQAANLKNVELPMLLPGIVVNTSPTDFHPLESFQIMRFDGTRWINTGSLVGN